MCGKEKWDDSFLLFRLPNSSFICEDCLSRIRHMKYYTINSRFKVVEKTISENYIVNNFTVKLSNGTKVIERTAKVDIGRDRSVVPKSDLIQLGYKIEPALSLDYPIMLSFENINFGRIGVIAANVEKVILGWDFVLYCLLPGIQKGTPDWIRGEQNNPEPVGPILTLLSGLSKTYADLIQSRRAAVVIIGQDTTEITRLRAIQHWLYRSGYDGILVKDLPDIPEQTIEEKVELLCSMCRFIICENTTPSGHIDELKICHLNRFITVILRKAGEGATWLQADYEMDMSFMMEFVYKQTVEEVLPNACLWAEETVRRRLEYLEKKYPWRSTERE